MATDPQPVYPSAPRPPFNELSVLFPLLTFYTVVYLGMMAVEFFLPKVLTVPAGMLPVYITLVGAYAAGQAVEYPISNTQLPTSNEIRGH